MPSNHPKVPPNPQVSILLISKTRRFLTLFVSNCAAVFWHVSLAHTFRATVGCNFSRLICVGLSAPAASVILLFDPPEWNAIVKILRFTTCLPVRAPAFSLFLLVPLLIFFRFLFFPVCLSPWLNFFLAVLFHRSIRPLRVWKCDCGMFTLGSETWGRWQWKPFKRTRVLKQTKEIKSSKTRLRFSKFYCSTPARHTTERAGENMQA